MGMFWEEEELEREPTPLEKEMYMQFVNEYMKDYNSTLAVLRMGYKARRAEGMGTQFLDTPFVQNEIMKRRQGLGLPAEITVEERQEILRRKTIATLEEVLQNGPYQTRVQAAKELNALFGWGRAQEHDETQQLIDCLKNFGQKAPV